MGSKKLIYGLVIIFLIINIMPALCNEKAKNLGLSEEEYVKLVKFSNKAKEIKSGMEKSRITPKEVRQILGKPEAIYENDEESIKVKGQKEIWMYWHPCYASVRFLLVFNKTGNLILFTAVQQLHPKIGDVYYDVDYFLE